MKLIIPAVVEAVVNHRPQFANESNFGTLAHPVNWATLKYLSMMIHFKETFLSILNLRRPCAFMVFSSVESVCIGQADFENGCSPHLLLLTVFQE